MTPRMLWALAALFMAVFIIGQLTAIGRPENIQGDESYYLWGGQEMIRSGDWLAPRAENGALRFNKPVFAYWMTGASMKALGVGLFQARLPFVIVTLAAGLLVYGLALVLLRDRTVALLAMMVHFSCEIVYGYAGQARPEAPLAFFVVGAIYFFARLVFQPGHERRDAILAGIMTSGAILTKGLAGVAEVLLPVAAFLLISWRWGGPARWRAAASPWMFGALVLFTAPWYVFALAHYGRDFTNAFVTDQVEGNITAKSWTILINVVRNIFDYAGNFLKNCLPWCAPVALALIFNDAKVRGAFRERRWEWIFLAAWFGMTLLVFIPADFVRGRYLLPVAPAFSILGGFVLGRILQGGERAKGLALGAALVAVMALACGAVYAGHLLVGAGAGLPVRLSESRIAAALMALGVVMFVMIGFRRTVPAALCGGVVLMVAMAAQDCFLPPRAPYGLIARAADKFIMPEDSGAQIVTVGYWKEARAIIPLYSGRLVTRWIENQDPDAQVEFLRELRRTPGEKLIFMGSRLFGQLPPDLKSGVALVGSQSGYGLVEVGDWLRRRRSLHDLIVGNPVTVCVVRMPAGSGDRS